MLKLIREVFGNTETIPLGEITTAREAEVIRTRVSEDISRIICSHLDIKVKCLPPKINLRIEADARTLSAILEDVENEFSTGKSYEKEYDFEISYEDFPKLKTPEKIEQYVLMMTPLPALREKYGL